MRSSARPRAFSAKGLIGVIAGMYIRYQYPGDDHATGTDMYDYIWTGPGNDTISGGGGGDWILAGDGNDIAYGDAGNDTIDGGAGNDVLYGGEGNDRLVSGGGGGLMEGGAGADAFVVGALGDGEMLTVADFNPLQGDTLEIPGGGVTLVGFGLGAGGSYTLTFAHISDHPLA